MLAMEAIDTLAEQSGFRVRDSGEALRLKGEPSGRWTRLSTTDSRWEVIVHEYPAGAPGHAGSWGAVEAEVSLRWTLPPIGSDRRIVYIRCSRSTASPTYAALFDWYSFGFRSAEESELFMEAATFAMRLGKAIEFDTNRAMEAV